MVLELKWLRRDTPEGKEWRSKAADYRIVHASRVTVAGREYRLSQIDGIWFFSLDDAAGWTCCSAGWPVFVSQRRVRIGWQAIGNHLTLVAAKAACQKHRESFNE